MIEFSGSIGHLEDIDWPWSNAGGVAKTTQDIEALTKTTCGMIEDGSHTLNSRAGLAIDPDCPELGPQFIVYTHNPKTGETGNCLGIPSPGFDIIEKEIPERVRIANNSHKKYIINVAPVSNKPIEETSELVARGYSAGAHAVLVNAGCPNVVLDNGKRHELLSRNPDQLRKVLEALKPIVERYLPIFLRISPQESFDHAKEIYKVIAESGVVSAVFTPNTWPGYRPTNEYGDPILQVPGGIGGLSGPATADLSGEQTRWGVRLLRKTNIDVIRSSGITNSNELKKALNDGAVAGAGTTFYYESINGWKVDTKKLISELIE